MSDKLKDALNERLRKLLPHYEIPDKRSGPFTVFELSELSRPGEQCFELGAGTTPGYLSLEHMLETLEWCQAEDTKRVHDLRALNQYEWTHLYRDGPLYLADWLEDGVTSSGYEPNRASAVSMRELRLRFLGSALDFVMQHRAGSPKWITARHPNWHFGFADYYRWKDIAVSVPRQFRAMLRIAGVMDAPGFLISYMHTQFDHIDQSAAFSFGELQPVKN